MMVNTDLSIVQRVIGAYETILNPSTAAESRKLAEAYCAEVKESGLEGFHVGLTLLDARNGYSLHLRNLGAIFVEFGMKCTFESRLASPQQHMLSREFWNFAFQTPGTLKANDRSMIKEKIATSLAVLGCRLWLRPEGDPVQWNDFFDVGLVQSVLNTPSPDPSDNVRRQELALMVISRIIRLVRSGTLSSSTTSTFESSSAALFSLSEERRNQLHSGLEIVLPAFMDWLFLNFPAAASRFQENEAVLAAAIECFQVTCTWMSGISVDGTLAFISASLEILSRESAISDDNNPNSVSIAILEAFTLLFAHRSFSSAELSIVEFFLQDSFTAVVSLIQRYTQAQTKSFEDAEGDYQRLKLLVQCITTIGSRYIGHRKTPLILKNLPDVLNLTLALTELSSLSLYLEILTFWSGLLKSAAFREKFNVSHHLPALFNALVTKMCSGEDRRRVFNQIDFEDPAEFREFWNLAHIRSGEVVRQSVQIQPQIVLELAHNALGGFIQSTSSASLESQPTRWKELLSIEVNLAKGLNSKDSPQPSSIIWECSVKHLHLLVVHSPQPQNLRVLSRWIDAVCEFTGLLGPACPSDAFQRIVEVLFNLATTAAIDEEIRVIAATSLLRLADMNSSLFAPFLEPLLAAISPHLNANGSNWERRLFSELILILMTQPSLSIERQMSLFSSVADPLVSLLLKAKEAMFSGSSSDPAINLMQRIGFAELEQATISKECRAFSSDLNMLASTLHLLFRRITPEFIRSNEQHPAIQAIRNILDELVSYLFLMVQILHRLGTPAAWSSFFNGSDREYSQFYPKMREFLDGSLAEEVSSDDSPSTVDSVSALTHCAGWIRNQRQVCYVVLGTIATNFSTHFFNLPALTDRFMGQAMSSLDGLALLDWATLIRSLLKPVLSATPVELIPSLVGGCLRGLLLVLGPLIDSRWTAITSSETADGSIKVNSTVLAQEIARERNCIKLSSALICFLVDILLSSATLSNESFGVVNVSYALQVDNLLPPIAFEGESLAAQWLFQEGPFGLLQSFTQFLNRIVLQWPKRVGVHVRIVSLQMRLLSAVMSRFPVQEAEQALCESANTLLSAFNLPSWQDHQNQLISWATEQYKWSFLLASALAYQGPLIFDSQATAKFVTQMNRKFTAPPVFDQILQSRFKIVSDAAIKSALLESSSNLKSQRAAMRSFLTKNVKVSITDTVTTSDTREKQLSSRLREMKKRLNNPIEKEDWDDESCSLASFFD